MKHANLMCGAAVLSLAAAGSARADLVAGASVIVPTDNTIATIEFLGSSAAYTGDMYFLGSGEQFSVLDWADNTDDTGLGQWLANNQSSTIGDTMLLDGVFSAGDVLHFAYNVTDVVNDPDGLAIYRTDDSNDGYMHFAWDESTGFLGVEDLPLYKADFDYNDAEFMIIFETVPAPGVLASFGLAGLIVGRRRRG